MKTPWLRCMAVAIVFVLGTAHAEEALYPRMAPIEQYLISDRNDEIALARSAAPESISREAEVMVLSPRGYETAVKGTNGWVCLVERSWFAPLDDAEYWNPKLRSPDCYNPLAARSLLPAGEMRTRLALAGMSSKEIADHLKAAYAANELHPPQSGAMCYMMSSHAYLSDHGSHNLAHLMIYTPIMKGPSWGADMPNCPVSVGVSGSAAEPFSMFVVAVSKWSDGTPVHAGAMMQ